MNPPWVSLSSLSVFETHFIIYYTYHILSYSFHALSHLYHKFPSHSQRRVVSRESANLFEADAPNRSGQGVNSVSSTWATPNLGA